MISMVYNNKKEKNTDVLPEEKKKKIYNEIENAGDCD